MDIAFGIHENLSEDDFNIMKYFVLDTLQRFEISDARTHAALITFGNETDIVFDFNDQQNLHGSLKRKLDDVVYKPGKGSLVDVLAAACEKIFCVAGGSRSNVPKVNLKLNLTFYLP